MKTLAAAAALAVVVVLASMAGGVASGATGHAASDIYITGKVVARVPGKNLADVDITWAYKCLGDKLGAATYEWTLKLVRTQPKPERTTTLGKGTTKRGTMGVRLTPGQYLPIADPYFCETERGAGYDKPEVGGPFAVPDYCAWSVTATRGLVQLEQGAAVKAAKPGSTVRPGDSVTTPRGGSASLASNGADGTAVAGPSTSFAVDVKQCAASGAWKLRLGSGTVMASVAPRAAKRNYQVGTPNASASGRPGARWQVDYSPKGKRTLVKARSGSVVVAGTRGPAVTVKAGFSTVVTGSGAPSKPTRG